MNAKSFIDSNVWLYTFMESSIKTAQAAELLNIQNVILSTQVINEICANLLKKARYTENEIQQTVHNIYANYEVVIINQAIILHASTLREKNAISYWDSLIVATAIKNNCTILYSEDMQHTQVIQNVKIINPFL